MLHNSLKILFFTTLLSGMLITISSNSWMSAWMGLEINLLSFIPLMSNNNNIFTTEAALKYFLIQALASSTLLFIIISKSLIESMFTILDSSFTSIMISTPLLMKSGAAPLHWWFPSVMEGLSWNNCFILMTIQKMAPLMLISYTINFNMFMTMVILMSVMIGAIGGYNQTSIRKILTYSSINHMGWMLTAMIMGENMWTLYFMIYSLLTLTIIMIIYPFQISFVNQIYLINEDNKIMKFFLFSSLLSLGGLPPFLGFMPKWMIIQFMVTNWSMTLMSIMVISSLITLYYYLRISYSAFMILNTEPCWSHKNNENTKIMNLSFLLMTFSMLGLMITTAFINVY
uniref:NADH dehydrogenase subunit 2 n=1 Tax=Rhabdoblatta nigrovittata TaxID=2609386 RepID=UPI0027A98D0A|nr:NADH dehydrogenase subunit 2 [Rhabdoblatta nigrovittata]WGO57600.1 NADH dehydrogenase subunit 2 [Rhabdoblatta nigrovittata]